MAKSRIKVRSYGELLEVLQQMTAKQLNNDLTVLQTTIDEYQQIELVVCENEEGDVIDSGHPYFEINQL